MSSLYFKIIASAILIIPIGFLLIFAIGEMVGGDIFGAQHFLQLAPIVILLALAWKFPRAIGAILIAASIILGIIYVIAFDFPIVTIVAAELLLFTPPLIAGVLFYFAGRKPVNPTATGMSNVST